MIFGGSIWIERKLMDRILSVICAIRERYDVIGGFNVQTAPMREQSVGVNALNGQLDLRSRLCSISSLGERLLRLEKAVSGPHDTENSCPSNGVYQTEIDVYSKKRKLDHVVSAKETPKSPLSNCPVVTPDESTHHAEHARVIIQSELDGNERMNRERQAILKSALEFVNSMARGADSPSDEAPTFDVPHDDCPDIPESIEPTPELLYMLLRGTGIQTSSFNDVDVSWVYANYEAESTVTTGMSHNVHWPDHISDKTLQKMVSKFFGGNLTGQKFYQYCTCIYVRAIFHTYSMPRLYNDSVMNEQFLKSKRIYAASALHALQNLNFLNTPSLSFIQALISATFLMQYLGNMSQAWVLNSYAARLIAALNYHNAESRKSDPDLEEEINSSVYWCFYLDRTLSSLLHRPSSLPELHSSASDLVCWNNALPHMPIIRILVDLAQVQGNLLSCCQVSDTRQILDNHSKLQERMNSIYSSLQSSRNSAPELINSEWVATEFSYYAILVDILRSRLRYAFSPLTHRECVSYSRKALKALQYLLKHLAKSPGFVDPYPTFLTWTIFLYPLSPFFVLFCNIIGELDMDDYRLIQDITQSLSPFNASPYIARLLKLLDTLQHLCEPLIQTKQHLGPQAKVAPWYPTTNGEQQEAMAVPDGSLALAASYLDSAAQPNPQHQQSDANVGMQPVADELMWHLFNSQPSLQWCESDVISLDPTVNY
ncbi:uncharacterized protein N7496_002424 [Penicillium cataractarum]|uniref:Xylanolytic transcriptional activator regulatory domain-containing protein n=1 Tax=Penicillium cataractarum TaxID=2100454 RepID=A0A9W9SK08_9EURO|nr:uncharacterized protein N7496_002424 [Penicillium cataractarum]KAJ5379996.1 hypothetical protein N7496_002424 [Penicillium cataractarum]